MSHPFSLRLDRGVLLVLVRRIVAQHPISEPHPLPPHIRTVLTVTVDPTPKNPTLESDPLTNNQVERLCQYIITEGLVEPPVDAPPEPY